MNTGMQDAVNLGWKLALVSPAAHRNPLGQLRKPNGARLPTGYSATPAPKPSSAARSAFDALRETVTA